MSRSFSDREGHGEEETEDPSLLGRSERNEGGDAVQPARLWEDQQPKRTSGSTVGGLEGDESDDGDYVPPQTGESDDVDGSSTNYEGDSDDGDSTDLRGIPTRSGQTVVTSLMV